MLAVPYFSTFGLNTDQKNYEYGHILRNVDSYTCMFHNTERENTHIHNTRINSSIIHRILNDISVCSNKF